MQSLYSPEHSISNEIVVSKAPARLVFIVPVIVAMIAVVYFYASQSRYIDYPNNCYIRIRPDILRGDKSTIKKALTTLKTDNPADYKTVCGFVNNISESLCLFSTKDNSQLEKANTKGCYLKGTKIIFIEPTQDTSESTVKDRMLTIVKFAKFSKNYWDSETSINQ